MASTSTKNVYQRLMAAQGEIVAPREINGRFGKARSAEQILEAVKPVCRDNGLLVHTTDVMHQVGDRNYITTTARVVNVDKPDEFVEADASAWENTASGGLDTSQVQVRRAATPRSTRYKTCSPLTTQRTPTSTTKLSQ